MFNKSKIKEIMPMLLPEIRVKNFCEVELGLNDKSALLESERCLNCKNPPCVKGCPVGVEIPKFIQFIKNGDTNSAYKTILKDNIFPAVCGRVCPQEKQCESLCVRGKTGEPVAIGSLERYCADKSLNYECSDEDKVKNKKTKCISEINAHKIAVVGSGPSGLTCASELAELGCEVTVFEALHTPGGVLAYGIPEFRLPRKVLDRELENLKNKGVNIVNNVVVGKSISINSLFEEGYSAIYISSGAGLPKFMNIPGEGLSGIYCANEFLTRVNLMHAQKENYDTPIVPPQNAIIVGGGNVAMDAARVAKRLGAKKVTVVYRRTENEMPARKAEISHAKEEGIEFLFLSNPKRFLGENGKLTEVECIKMQIDKEDSSGRKSVIPIEGSEFRIPVDMAVIAVGNSPNTIIKNSESGLDFDSRGRIIIDSDTMQTSRKFIYAGGDAVTGAATVILAMGAGKKAAHRIVYDLNHVEVEDGR